MATPALVIVTGPPASGKSSLATRLSADLGLPCFAKDALKERLFDSLGWGEPDWSRRLGSASTALLYHIAGVLLEVGQSCILECNFRPEQALPQLTALYRRHPYRPVQIHCDAPVDELLRRFRSRWAGGRRHPGHVDAASEEQVRASLEAHAYGPIAVGGVLIQINTASGAGYDYGAVRAAVAEAVAADAR